MDEINLKLPAKPEYISVARLTTSAIANRLDFRVDEIEDLKVSVSEAGIYLINQISGVSFLTFDFLIHEDRHSMTVHVKAIDGIGNKDSMRKETELSLFIIESVTDHVSKDVDQGVIRGFSIYKTGGGNLE